MSQSEQAKILREMAAEWLRAAKDVHMFSLPHQRKQDSDHCKAKAAALTAGAEALEAMSLKQRSAKEEEKWSK